MNNTFIFTPANSSKAADVGAALNFNATSAPRSEGRKSEQPFSKVLDRAVQTPKKNRSEDRRETRSEERNNPLTAGRSEEHRSERSVEAHADHRLEREQREAKKNAEPTAESSTPVICVAATTVVMNAVEITPETLASGEASETSVAGDVETISTTASAGAPTLVGSTAAAPIVPQTVRASAPAADTGATLTPVQGDESADAELLATVQGGLAASPDAELETASRLISAASQELEENLTTSGINGDAVEEAITSGAGNGVKELPALTARTAREVALGAARESQAVAATEESVANPAAEVAVAAAAVAPEVARPLRAARRDRAENVENNNGMAAAKLDVTMNNAVKKEEIAGLSGQKMPGAVAAVQNLPGEAARLGGREISTNPMLNSIQSVGPARSDSSEVHEALPSNAATTTARIGEIISREVRMFKRGGDDLVEVVLTPDTRTQISLRLQWRDGQVEVQARCDMGNYHSLNQDWGQLQAALAGHGVRLSHLSERVHTGFTEFFNNSGFSQHRGGERDQTSRQSGAETFLTPVPSPAKSSAAKTVKSPNQRLESWA